MEKDKIIIPLKKVLLDSFILFCTGFPILILYLYGKPFERGFFCNDETISYPYRDSTVKSLYLYIVGLGLNCIIMIVTEYFLSMGPNGPTYIIFGKRIPNWLINAYCVIGVFAFGAACSQLITDIMKYMVGRLRPHFFEICKPNVNCSNVSFQYKYIVNYVCTNVNYKANDHIYKEMRLSFPSGHSSFSMYTMTYFAIYIQARMTWNGSKLCKHAIQLFAVGLAIFTAMTRIFDYKHHWSDVLSGLLIGATVACLNARFVSNLFPTEHRNDERTSSNERSRLNGASV